MLNGIVIITHRCRYCMRKQQGRFLQCPRFVKKQGIYDSPDSPVCIYERREFDISTSLLNMAMSQPEHILQHKRAENVGKNL